VSSLIPTTNRGWSGIQKCPALRALIRLFPQSNPVAGGNRTDQFPFNPRAHPAWRQSVQKRGESRHSFGLKRPVRGRFKGNHRVVQLLAIGTQDGLDHDLPAMIGATRNPGAIATSGTFELIRAAHTPFPELLSRAIAGRTTIRRAGIRASLFWNAATCRRFYSADMFAHSKIPANGDARPAKDYNYILSLNVAACWLAGS
jgi:hypothetical protein